MENENLQPVEKLTPFTRMIMTIGTLPSSFYASMSYYESMVWLYEYLKNEVIPTVNNNAEAVEELQEAFTTLKNYIDNYFDNLDVQEEINKKLDEMALDGTLTNLIKNYVDPLFNELENDVEERINSQDTDISNFKSLINTQITTINNKVDSATSGSPKGVYDTVSDLETADPNHDYIYVVSETGKWYYYDTTNTSWTAGGDYQAPEDSKTVEELDFELDPFKTNYTNLYDKTAAEDNKYIRSDNGNASSTDQALCASDYIPIKANTNYYVYGLYSTTFAFYNLDKEYITNDNYVTTVDNYKIIRTDVDCYFRFTSYIVYKDLVTVSQYTDMFNDYGERSYDYLDYTKDYINTKGYATGKYNLFNGEMVYGGLGYTTGILNPDTAILTTDFISIKDDLYYQVYNGKQYDISYVFEYDTDKHFIKYTTSTYPKAHITLDNNTRYVRLRSQTNSGTFELNDIDFYKNNLMVTNKEEYLDKWLPYNNVIKADDVASDFYKTSSTFKRTFIKTALDNYINTITNSSYDLVVPIITDTHGGYTGQTYNEGLKMLNYLASSGFADVCFDLGDIIPDHYDTLEEAVKFLKISIDLEKANPLKSKVITLRGNHDTNPQGLDVPTPIQNAKMINDELFYSIAENRLTEGIANSGLNYGYIDTNAKIRLIYMDTSDIFNDEKQAILTGYTCYVGQEQLDWLCNTALNFKDKENPSEWGVIILSHDYLQDLGTGYEDIISAFMNGTSASGTLYSANVDPPQQKTYNVDFTEQGPVEFICSINGHSHDDRIIEIGNTGKYQISIACDSAVAHYYDGDTKYDYSRTPDTIEEHLIDSLCINKENKTITMKRLGVGNDRTINY